MTALRSRRPRPERRELGTKAPPSGAAGHHAHGRLDPRAARLRVGAVFGPHPGAAALRARFRGIQARDRRARGLLPGGHDPGLAARWVDRDPHGGPAHHGGRPAAVHRLDRRVWVRLRHRGARRAAVRPGNGVRLHLGRRPGVGDCDLAPRPARRDARIGSRVGDLRHADRPAARYGGGGSRDGGRVRVRRRRVAGADGVDAAAPRASPQPRSAPERGCGCWHETRASCSGGG